VTRKELSETYDLFHRGHMSSRTVKEVFLDVLVKLTDEEQTKVIEQVAILVFGKAKKKPGPFLGMMLPLCRPNAPKHSFEYLMMLNLQDHKDDDSLRFTLGHEIAHLLLGHLDHCKGGRKREEAADNWCWEHGIYPEWVVTKPSLDLNEYKDAICARRKVRHDQ